MKKSKLKVNSWNFIPKSKKYSIQELNNKKNLNFSSSKTYLAHGMGRSYGDVCLNNNGEIILTENYKKIINFDIENGYIECESGLTIKQLLEFIVPKGWFLPVVPGTSYVTIGGAVANDIHGKNHHIAGSFGNFVEEFKLITSKRKVFVCSLTENSELFKATIGGLGLTGLILSVKIKLIKINNEFIQTSVKRFYTFDQYLQLNKSLSQRYEYTVSWIDFNLKNNKKKLKGVYIYGNHSKDKVKKSKKFKYKLAVPFRPPFSIVNNFTINLINLIYFYLNKSDISKLQHYKSFFFPLDIISNWNKAYGNRGFYQYQFVVPEEHAREVLDQVYLNLKKYNQRVCLGVLKSFGDIQSCGIMSFPRKGITLALDLQNKGPKTLELLTELDRIVLNNLGNIYPAKDARMSREVFNKINPRLKEFKNFIDPKFNSSFKNRVF